MSEINLDAGGRVYSFPTLFPGFSHLEDPPPPPGVREGGKMREAGNDVDIHRSPSNPLGIIYIFTGLKYQEAIYDCDCRNSYVVSPFDRI